ncbi:MAG: metallophosphoesterase family protein [Thermoanaerobacterales bacterium]|nr:metallophosphoesterase family protein [Thermoanaerobacterales bacterium]
MKLLYLTDTHIRNTNPPVRQDDFAASLKAKLTEIVALANELGVEAVLHGGDFFDLPCPSLSEAGEFLSLFTALRAPVYAVAGNHDVFAYDPGTMGRTMLGFLARLGHLRLLPQGRAVYLDDGRQRIQLTGTHFHRDIDRRDPRLDYCVTKNDCDVAVHVAHGMLLDAPLEHGPSHTVIADIAPFTEADVTLGSHAHFGYPDVHLQGKLFVNPGSVARMSAHPADLVRRPQVIMLDFDAGPLPVATHIPLASALPGPQVIDPEAGVLAAACGEALRRLAAGASAGAPEGADDLETDLVLQAKEDGVSPEVVHEALRLLAAARREVAV